MRPTPTTAPLRSLLLGLTLAAPVGLLAACGDKDDGAVAPGTDADGDGFTVEVDCDDSSGAVHPGAPETCNEIDDDCDGDIDEDPEAGTTFYVDADGDGSGNAAYPLIACSPPQGYVDNADDCNDASAVSYPGADELCDGLDNDCDEDVDENPVDSPTWYVDEDGDGYGDPAVPIEVCGAPGVYVQNGDDCDDSDASLNPDTVWYGDIDGDGYGGSDFTWMGCEPPARHVDNELDCDDDDPTINPEAEEVCDDIDNDCDGTVDGETATDAIVYYEDLDLDDWGTEVSTALGCTPPEGFAEALGDCDDTRDDVNPGELERCGDDVDNDCDDGIDDYCQLSLAEADVIYEGEALTDYAGYQLSGSGDFDGDGYNDLATGAYGSDVAGSAAGRGYVLLGPFSAGTTGSLADASLIVDGNTGNDFLGYAVKLGADATGDTYDDVAFGAWGADRDSSSGVGGAFLFAGPTTGSVTAADADAMVLGESSLDYLGQYELHVGRDLDHDGQGDLMVAASGIDEPYSSGGALLIYQGPVSGELGEDDTSGRVNAAGNAHYVGFSATVGDIDGDGLDDIAWGASGDTAAYAILGPVVGDVDSDDAEVFVNSTASDALGSDVALGDFDDDGTIDFAIGAKYDGSTASNAGAWIVIPGPLSGDYTSDDAVFKVTEVDTGRYLGAQYMQVATGDVDGDGTDDLFVGSSDNGFVGSASGAGFLFLGPLSGTTNVSLADMGLLGEGASNVAGYGVDLADMDGDGDLDALIGGRGWDSSTGRAYIVLDAGF